MQKKCLCWRNLQKASSAKINTVIILLLALNIYESPPPAQIRSSYLFVANVIQKMGNGEVFYGKRKYKPSGKVSSEYNGGGFTDYRKIEAAREFREMRAMMREKAIEEGDGGKER